MNVRRTVMVLALGALAVVASMVAVRGVRGAAPVRAQRIELADGRLLEGTLVRVRDGSYLLQDANGSTMLAGDQIRSVNGRGDGSGAIAAAGRVTLESETFEIVGADGSLEVHAIMRRDNDGHEALSQVDWGIAPHEVEQLAGWRVVDQFGDELRPRVEDDPATRGKRVHVDLPRPVLPGERLTLTNIVRQPHAVVRQGDAWVYRHRGDYPEDRLVTRSVLLPRGASVLSVTPEPVHDVVVGEQRLVVWRRYFRAGEVGPWEIRFRM